MNVTGVGSTYNFLYHTKTNKLSTKDGSENEFVDFYNGDVKGEDTETLNHFDAHTRYQFERMLYVYGTGMTGQDPFANNDEVEITADIESATKTSFYVNGQKAFTAYTGMSYLPSEIKTFGTIQQPFRTTESKPYDPKTNSITIGIGSKFDLGNGYSMTVMEDCIWGEGYGNGSLADDERTNMMVGGLSSLLHFADQQWFSSTTDIYTDYILEFLESQGVDTSREFVINGTHCELVNGKIREVGNDYVVPSSIQQEAIKRYEEKMGELLKDGNWYGMASTNHVADSTSEDDTSEIYSKTNVASTKTDGADSSEKTSKMQVWHQGKTLEEWSKTDTKYTDAETGISWYVRDGKYPYMTGEDSEKLRKMCEETGEPWLKKFAEITGIIQYLDDDTTAYVGDNGIAIKSKNGQELFIDTSSLTYDTIMSLFRNMDKNADYFDRSYWENSIARAVTETAGKETTAGQDTDYSEILQEKINEIFVKIQNGDTEPTFQIGSSSFTQSEWEEFLDKFDSIEEALEELTKEEQERKEAEEARKENVVIKDTAALLTTDSTFSVQESAESDGEAVHYITWYTEDGIFCRKAGQTEGYEWAIPFDDKEQYGRVMEFIRQFSSDDDTSFAADENFWKDFLNKN